MLQDIVEDDAVEGLVGGVVGVAADRDGTQAVCCQLGRRGVGFDSVDMDALLGEDCPESALVAADIKQPLGAPGDERDDLPPLRWVRRYGSPVAPSGRWAHIVGKFQTTPVLAQHCCQPPRPSPSLQTSASTML